MTDEENFNIEKIRDVEDLPVRTELDEAHTSDDPPIDLTPPPPDIEPQTDIEPEPEQEN